MDPILKGKEIMEIKRILVSRTDKIGDLVLSIPSFFMLKKMYPNAELVAIVRKYNMDIVKNLPYIDRFVILDEYTKAELLEKIAYFKADVFIALYNDSYVASLARASKAKIKIGPISKLSSIFTYNKGVLQKRSRSVKNEGQYNLDLVAKLNKKRFAEVYELNTKMILTDENKKVADVYFKENSIQRKCLVVNPFIGGSAKNITDRQYVNILKKVKEKIPDLNIIITSHITDEERTEKLCKDIGQDKIFTFSNGASILNTASIIDRADVYFGGSTGPTHVAGALGKKIVAIYPHKKTQSPTRWGVLGNSNVRYIIPDENNPNEDYNNPYFDNFTEDMEDKVVKAILEALK